MQTLFKNARLVDFENQTTRDVDILVENGKIVVLDKIENFEGNFVDLQNSLVCPPFVNSYSDSLKGFENSYGVELDYEDEKLIQNVKTLSLIKNVLSGALFVNDVNNSAVFKGQVLQDVDLKSDKELSKLSFACANSEQLLMKVGQTLDELGAVDKTYHKLLVEVLEDFGFLDRNCTVVGGNCFEKDELEILSNYDCKFILTPYEDARFGKRPNNVISLLSKVFEPAIGSGQVMEVDYFSYMRQILLSQRGMFEDENILTEADVLKMAIENGAKILGFENEIKVGNNANFIAINNANTLSDNPLKALVWEKSKNDVNLCVFNGEILQKNGEIFMKNSQNYDTIIREIKQTLRRN